MTTQPILPAPIAPSVVEQAFIEDSPPGLWPDNQDSNFGIHRKIFCDELMDAVNQLQTIFNEMFPNTSVQFIEQWEEEMGLTINPPGRTLSQRQSAVISRSRRGAFTKTGRAQLVENFIVATFGAALAFGTGGIPIGSGVPLHSGVNSLIGTYRIYEDVRNFSYVVRILSSITPDIGSLTRELLRYTPAGISFTIDNTVANVLFYDLMLRGDQPVWSSGLDGNANDSSGYANNGTLVNAPASVSALVSGVANGGGGSALSFNGTNQYITIPNQSWLDPVGMVTFEAWINPSALPSSGNRMVVYGDGALNNYLGINNIGGITFASFSLMLNGVQSLITGTTHIATGTIYHLVGTFDGVTMRLYVNGVLESSLVISGSLALSGTKQIGRSASGASYFNGVIDDPAIYDYELPADKVLEHHNTGINVA